MAQPFVEPCSRGLIAAEPCPRELGREIAPARRRMVLAACILASAMAFIDGSALTVALPSLRATFDADLATVQWVLNGYVVALASLTLIGGALADVHGKARILSLGCILFGLASAACALAPTAAWLIAARVLQGIAAALLTPASLALIGAVYPKEERNRAIGMWAAASALTTAGGPVLGGWLTQAFGWQSIFWINPPLALAAAGLLAAFAPQDQREARRFDIVGAAILAASLAALAFALSQIDAAHAAMRGAELTAVAVSAVIGLLLYVAWERTSAHPMTPPRLAHNTPFVGLNLATLLVYAGLSVMFFVLPFELVERRGHTPTDAGLVFLPFTLGVGLLARFFGGMADRIGARTMLIAGPVGAALAYVWMALGRDASLLAGIVVPMSLLGVSFAVLVAPLTASVMSSVASADEGLASGINNAISRVAQLIGVALAAGVASLAIGHSLGLIAAAVLSLAGAGVVAARVPPALQDRSPPIGSTR
jgi:EmrB/QacA subfamily drug resistance transporter